MEHKYERYMEIFKITEWRDDCIFKTQSLGCDWFSDEAIKANIVRETNLMYVAANDDFANSNMTIRIAK